MECGNVELRKRGASVVTAIRIVRLMRIIGRGYSRSSLLKRSTGHSKSIASPDSRPPPVVFGHFIRICEHGGGGPPFAAQFASPAMSVILDVKAMSSESRSIPQIIRESAGQFAYFHANDTNLKGPGFREVDFVLIAAALSDVGSDGMVSVEVFTFDEGPEAIATQSREYLRKTFDQ